MKVFATSRITARSGPVIASMSARGVICQVRPDLSLHQPHGAILTDVANHRAPLAIGFRLIVRGILGENASLF